MLEGLYEEIRNSKDYDRLINLVQNGQIGPDEKDGNGLSPLIFAVDCEVPLDVVKRLEKAGCDVNA